MIVKIIQQLDRYMIVGYMITFKANIPKRWDPLRAQSTEVDTSEGVLLMNNPYKPIPKINITVPAR
jgi:hypothetical protein